MKEIKEVQKVLEELIGLKPEQLTGEAKRLFEAIMKIADERDELLKERQADKEKIKELYEIIINNKPHIAQQKLKLYIQKLLKDGGE